LVSSSPITLHAKTNDNLAGGELVRGLAVNWMSQHFIRSVRFSFLTNEMHAEFYGCSLLLQASSSSSSVFWIHSFWSKPMNGTMAFALHA